jgi:hypothetical protein
MDNSKVVQLFVDAYMPLIYLNVKSELDKRERLSRHFLSPLPDIKIPEIPIELLQQSILEDILDSLCGKLADKQMDKIRQLAEQKLKEL